MYMTLGRIYKLLKVTVYIALVLGTILFLLLSKIIILTKYSIQINEIQVIGVFPDLSAVITTQITISLVVVSLLSWLMGISERRIYGRKMIKLAFVSEITIFLYFIAIFLLIFINSVLYLRGSSKTLIVLFFFASFSLVMVLIFKFGLLFVFEDHNKIRILAFYYKKHLKLLKARKEYSVEYFIIDDFKKDTISKVVLSGDQSEYKTSIIIYLHLIVNTLANDKNAFEAFYIKKCSENNLLRCEDFISHYLLFIDIVFKKKTSDAIHYINILIKHLNYFEFKLPKSLVKNRVASFINKILDIESMDELCSYITLLSEIIITFMVHFSISSEIYNSYKNQFSNYYNGYLADIYSSVYKHPKLSKQNKNYVINYFRHSLTQTNQYLKESSECFLEASFKKNSLLFQRTLNVEEQTAEMIAESLAMNFLAILKNKDVSSFSTFWSLCIENRIDSISRFLVNLSVVKSLLAKHIDLQKKMAKKSIKGIYMSCNIDVIKNALKSQCFFHCTINNDSLIGLYRTICSKFVEHSEEETESCCSEYVNFSFSQKLIDNYFVFVAEKNQISEAFLYNIENTIEKDDEFNKLLIDLDNFLSYR